MFIYIYTGAGIKSDSVQSKVMNQIHYLNANGFPTTGAFFSTEIFEEKNYTDQIKLLPVPCSKKKLFRNIYDKRLLINQLYKYIQSIPDGHYIYMRYPGPDLSLQRLTGVFGNRMIMEFQSKDIEEVKIYRKQNPFHITPSSILGYIQYYIYPIFCERLYAGKIIRNLRKRVAVTDEIATHYREKANQSSLPFFISSNAINTENYKGRKLPSDIDTIKLLILSGASSSAPWYGIDRLIKSIETYKGNIKFKLYIIGNTQTSPVIHKSFIEYVPYIQGNELDNYFDICHIAVGPLGMSRIKLSEASPLKVREYYSRGIPFIYAYHDTDIEQHEEAKEFALRFPNDESIIDMEMVKDFAMQHHKNPSHANLMRKIAEEHLSYRVKMKKLGHFLIGNHV